MSNNNQDRSKGKLPKLLLVSYGMRRASYVIRGLAGIYLVYLMYQMFSESGRSGGTLSVPLFAAGVFLFAAGIHFIISAAYALLNGIYSENDPGKLESSEADAETESGLPGQESNETETE